MLSNKYITCLNHRNPMSVGWEAPITKIYQVSRAKKRESVFSTMGLPGLCSSQPARDWKSCFLFFIFFILIIIFLGLKIIIAFLSPLSFFIIFSFLFFPPLAFSFFFPLLRKWSLVLGNCHQRLFLEPFSSVFSIAFAL